MILWESDQQTRDVPLPRLIVFAVLWAGGTVIMVYLASQLF